MEYAITNAVTGEELYLIMRNERARIARLKDVDSDAFNRLRELTVTRRDEIKTEKEAF